MPPTICIINNTVQGQVNEDIEGEELLAAQQATLFLEKLEAMSNLEAV
jgi:superfamily II DNA helicase RecQ